MDTKLPGFPEALRALRERSGISQYEFAERAHTSQAQISAYETGRRDPGTATTHRLLAALGCDFGDLEDALREARGDEPRPPRKFPPELHEEGQRAMEANLQRMTEEVDRRVARIVRQIQIGSREPDGDDEDSGAAS